MAEHPLRNKTDVTEEKTIQLVIAHLKNQDFGVPIDQIREVIRHTYITPIPDSPPFIAGVTSFHGEMALIIDLSIYFSLSNHLNKTGKHIIVIRHNKELYGLLVDEVTEIIRVPESTIKAAPEFIRHINSDYISGVYVASEEHLIMIFNLETILSEEEMAALDNLKKNQVNKQVISDV